MSQKTLLRAVETAFVSWAATPVAVANRAFNPATQAPNGEFIRLTVLPASSLVASLGDVTGWLEECEGVIDIAIFTPPNKGANRGFELADMVKAILDRKQFANGTLHCWSGTVTNIGSQDDDFYQVTVTVPFLYQPQRS